MRTPYLVPLALAFVLGGCAGGGGGSGAPVAPINGPIVLGNATFPLSLTVPNKVVASSARSPRYVSPATASVAVYDGSTVIYVGNFNQASNPQFTTVYDKTGTTTVAAGTCVPGTSTSVCTLTITTTIGAHTFDVITYASSQGQQTGSIGRATADIGAIPTFIGYIISEGELPVTLSPGTNPGQTITLLGVAYIVTFTGPVLTQHLNGNGPLVGIIGTMYTFQYVVGDPHPYQIVQPGNYDNGPVSITETDGGNIVTMTPISQAAPPASAGSQTFNVTCLNSGTAQFSATAQNKPNATYASGLTYSSNNYATAALGGTSIQCVPNSATLPITVQ